MGVPKFYRWISERYPCLSEIVKDHQIPEFDNLYLDMNGIIHACSHPEDNNPHFRITEEKIFADIFHYLEVLFRMIKPRKVFFMAVDGVAPRAKMNQQRSRRFRSAKESESLEKAARKRGEKLPAEARFDSNCITPGTPFMVRLHENLKYFVTNKMSTDSLWHGVTVYLSGHETPGEGEHKIMDFIRCLKASSTYDPNTRHCLYGLDADLIMLGLTSHEPHFALLREEVRFGKVTQKRSVTVEDTVFHLFHISLLREYLDLEFQSVKQSLMLFEYNLERIIDDWVLMGFLVGNDFIPHLPHLHIAHDALPTIWAVYKQVLPELDGYLNEGGVINLKRLEIFLRSLSDFDMEKFEEDAADLNWLESRKDGSRQQARARKPVKKVEAAAMNQRPDELDSFEPSCTEPVEGLEVEGTPFVPEREAGETDKSFLFRKQKSHYYYSKMNLQATPEVLAQQACDYITGLQWILLYYYRGVPSWGWFFPHHYAPYMSDLKCFSDLSMEFTPGSPFLPFQQLMAVLPAASKQLLPEPYQGLMTESTSPILEFYPVDFETDMNGKQQDWEAIVLIPFIQQDRLLAAMSEREPQLTQEERERNKHGPCLIYSYSKESQGMYPACAKSAFPDIVNNHTIVETRNWWEFVVPPERLNTGLCASVRSTLYYPGFPTLSHIPHRSYLQKMGVQVFQQPSRGENRIIQILDELDMDNLKLDELGSELIGKSVWVNWPHLIEAKVTAIETDEYRIETARSAPNVLKVNMDEDKRQRWLSLSNNITSVYEKRKGVDIGPTFVIVYAVPIAGRKYVYLKNARVTVEKEWQKVPVAFALQACVRHEVMLKGGVDDFGSLQTFLLSDVFPVNSTGFLLSLSHYGCQALVLGVEDGRVRICVDVPEEPDFAPLMQRTKAAHYMMAYQVAQMLGLGSHFVSRITGSLFLVKNGNDSVNIGLDLKNNKKNEECPGFTRKKGNDWMYSQETVNAISAYLENFPEFCTFLQENLNSERLLASKAFPVNTQSSVDKLVEFIHSLPTYKCPRAPCGGDFLEEETVRSIEHIVDDCIERCQGGIFQKAMTVEPHLLYRPFNISALTLPDPDAQVRLFDRVVNVRQGFTVPFGLRGTVIGIIAGAQQQDTVYEVVFDVAFPCGLTTRCSPDRGYRVPPHSIINLSHGLRSEASKVKPETVKSNIKNKQSFSSVVTSRQTQKSIPGSSMHSEVWSNMKSVRAKSAAESKSVQSAPIVVQRQENTATISAAPRARPVVQVDRNGNKEVEPFTIRQPQAGDKISLDLLLGEVRSDKNESSGIPVGSAIGKEGKSYSKSGPSRQERNGECQTRPRDSVTHNPIQVPESAPDSFDFTRLVQALEGDIGVGPSGLAFGKSSVTSTVRCPTEHCHPVPMLPCDTRHRSSGSSTDGHAAAGGHIKSASAAAGSPKVYAVPTTPLPRSAAVYQAPSRVGSSLGVMEQLLNWTRQCNLQPPRYYYTQTVKGILASVLVDRAQYDGIPQHMERLAAESAAEQALKRTWPESTQLAQIVLDNGSLVPQASTGSALRFEPPQVTRRKIDGKLKGVQVDGQGNISASQTPISKTQMPESETQVPTTKHPVKEAAAEERIPRNAAYSAIGSLDVKESDSAKRSMVPAKSTKSRLAANFSHLNDP